MRQLNWVFAALIAVVGGCKDEPPKPETYAACASDGDCTNGERCAEWSSHHMALTSHMCADRCCIQPAADDAAKARMTEANQAEVRIADRFCKPLLAAMSAANEEIHDIVATPVETREEAVANAKKLHDTHVSYKAKLEAVTAGDPKLKKPWAAFVRSFAKQAEAAGELRAAVEQGDEKAIASASEKVDGAQKKSDEALKAVSKLCGALVVPADAVQPAP